MTQNYRVYTRSHPEGPAFRVNASRVEVNTDTDCVEFYRDGVLAFMMPKGTLLAVEMIQPANISEQTQ